MVEGRCHTSKVPPHVRAINAMCLNRLLCVLFPYHV